MMFVELVASKTRERERKEEDKREEVIASAKIHWNAYGESPPSVISVPNLQNAQLLPLPGAQVVLAVVIAIVMKKNEEEKT